MNEWYIIFLPLNIRFLPLNKAGSDAASLHVPNLTDELSTAEERCLN